MSEILERNSVMELEVPLSDGGTLRAEFIDSKSALETGISHWRVERKDWKKKTTGLCRAPSLQSAVAGAFNADYFAPKVQSIIAYLNSKGLG